MNPFSEYTAPLSEVETLHPDKARGLRRLEIIFEVFGVTLAVFHRGLTHVTAVLHWELGCLILLAMLFTTVSLAIRYHWCRVRSVFVQEFRISVVSCAVWLAGVLLILVFGPISALNFESRAGNIFAFTELMIVGRGFIDVLTATRRAAARGFNPALILIVTFAGLVFIGTAMLMLPAARGIGVPVNESLSDQFRTALFTATSASCVTGLIVVPTGGELPYWSRSGQWVILCLFQLGGLGIMTCGAFFAVAIGNSLQVRENVALRDMLESTALGEVRRILMAILGVTLTAEFAGAVLLSGLWSDLPVGDQIFHAMFHSVSAFCNAGFSLTPDSYVGLQNHWEVWAATPLLIISGGLGFAVLYNLGVVLLGRFDRLRNRPLFNLPTSRRRLTLSTRLVLITTAGLLLGGMLGYFLLETLHSQGSASLTDKLNAAWFQAVTFRTAGFNTVDLGQLQPATKLFAVMLMFIGASPGSTGGGVKTMALAIILLALHSILRGRNRVEVMGRTIPTTQVNRAIAIMLLGVATLMTTTILLVIFENQPDMFLDHLFEAASACATVGVSTGITAELQTPSQFVLIGAMFLGRVGPLTLLMALGTKSTEARYQYPEESIALG